MREQKKSIGYKFDLSVWSILSVLWLFLLISFDPKFHLLSFIIYHIISFFLSSLIPMYTVFFYHKEYITWVWLSLTFQIMPVRYDVDIKSIMPEGEYLLLFVMTSVFFFSHLSLWFGIPAWVNHPTGIW